jgi:uncharacterized protein YecE (DUF72 family)
MPQLRLGISGWNYDNWRGTFYPDDLPQRRQLAYASRCFNSIELNGSFYALQRPDTYRRWYEETPPGFCFAVKGSRFITHNKKLTNVEIPLANFFASGVLLLKEKLGPIIWQLSPHLTFDPQRLDAFLELLPHHTADAARLAGRHDRRLHGRSWTCTDHKRRLRHALEIRHESFLVPGFVRLARRHGTAIVFSHSADWPYTEEVTAGYVYLRLHGSPETYVSPYSDAALERWAARIRTWQVAGQPDNAERITDRQPPRRKTRDVYVYFDNDKEAHAPNDARRLAERLGLTVGPDKFSE